jgi:Protein of unknown function (DUF2281)
MLNSFLDACPSNRLCYCVAMSTAELILEKTSKLPDELQQEALHYVDSLLARQAENAEQRNWARFSAQQLAVQYASEDAIYDQD